MEFFIEQTRSTPHIEYDKTASALSMKGRSSPENPILFYQRVMDFMDESITASSPILEINICMEYFNTSSTKCIFNLLKKVNDIQDELGETIVINWYYEEWDDDMLEIGEDFSYCLELEFNLREVDDINNLAMEAA